jgi:hypothetical protein
MNDTIEKIRHGCFVLLVLGSIILIFCFPDVVRTWRTGRCWWPGICGIVYAFDREEYIEARWVFCFPPGLRSLILRDDNSSPSNQASISPAVLLLSVVVLCLLSLNVDENTTWEMSVNILNIYS